MTFFPGNWQDFPLATKPCLNNLVDSLVSLPLVPEHSCVMRAWVGFRTRCTWWATQGTPTWEPVPAWGFKSPQLHSSFRQVYTMIKGFFPREITKKRKFERWCPLGFFRSICPMRAKFSPWERLFCSFGINSRKKKKSLHSVISS